ncbi:hypothetical protein [Streptomyces wuyuanensis]|uniref:hypothetical protein n=1 Tax=Streptomyces wuyuanensis TaxID=1196353 RepID=UPI00342DC549
MEPTTVPAPWMQHLTEADYEKLAKLHVSIEVLSSPGKNVRPLVDLAFKYLDYIDGTEILRGQYADFRSGNGSGLSGRDMDEALGAALDKFVTIIRQYEQEEFPYQGCHRALYKARQGSRKAQQSRESKLLSDSIELIAKLDSDIKKIAGCLDDLRTLAVAVEWKGDLRSLDSVFTEMGKCKGSLKQYVRYLDARLRDGKKVAPALVDETEKAVSDLRVSIERFGGELEKAALALDKHCSKIAKQSYAKNLRHYDPELQGKIDLGVASASILSTATASLCVIFPPLAVIPIAIQGVSAIAEHVVSMKAANDFARSGRNVERALTRSVLVKRAVKSSRRRQAEHVSGKVADEFAYANDAFGYVTNSITTVSPWSEGAGQVVEAISDLATSCALSGITPFGSTIPLTMRALRANETVEQSISDGEATDFHNVYGNVGHTGRGDHDIGSGYVKISSRSDTGNTYDLLVNDRKAVFDASSSLSFSDSASGETFAQFFDEWADVSGRGATQLVASELVYDAFGDAYNSCIQFDAIRGTWKECEYDAESNTVQGFMTVRITRHVSVEYDKSIHLEPISWEDEVWVSIHNDAGIHFEHIHEQLSNSGVPTILPLRYFYPRILENPTTGANPFLDKELVKLERDFRGNQNLTRPALQSDMADDHEFYNEWYVAAYRAFNID